MASRPIRRGRSSRTRLLTVASLLIIGGPLTGAAPAAAHADLLVSNPAASAILERAPEEIVLDFSEPVSTIEGSVELYAETGIRVDIGTAAVAADDPSRVVAADVPALEAGQFVVAWRVLSADGHLAEGAFSFQVGTSSTADGDLVSQILAGLSERRRPPAGLDAVRHGARFAVFAGLSALFGALAFAVAIGGGLRRLRAVLIGGLVAAFLGTAVHFVTQGPYAVGGSWGGIVDTGLWSDVWSTRNGKALVARLILLGIAAALLAAARSVARRSATWWRSSTALVGAGTIMTLSASGHPSSSSLAGLAVGVDAVHLSAIVIWIGGLLALTRLRPVDDSDEVRIVATFSRWATVAVPIAVATGLWQTWHLIPSWEDLTATSWGRALVVKSAFVVAAVTIGGVARWMVANHLGASIKRLLLIELVVVAGVLASTTALVANPPQVQAASNVFTASLVDGSTIVDVTVTPARVGANEIHLTVRTPNGALAPVESATVRLSQPDSEVPPLEVPTEVLGPDHFSGSVSLLEGGPWTMEILVQMDPSSVTRLTTTVDVAG
ncbi:MAG: copper resistance CopC/CopD family protein [Actinomycetota bacterium]